MNERVIPPTPAAPISAEALFRAHARFIAGFIKRLGVAHEEVDDAVQEVFLIAHRKGGFEGRVAKPTTWLAEIAIRVVSTQRRTAKRRRTTGDEDAVGSAVSNAASPLDTTEQRAALTRVDKALQSLDVDRRAVFILYELEEEPCEAIAAGLGIPIGTVHSRLAAARKMFFEAYSRLEKATPMRGTSPSSSISSNPISNGSRPTAASSRGGLP